MNTLSSYYIVYAIIIIATIIAIAVILSLIHIYVRTQVDAGPARTAAVYRRDID